MLISVDFWEPLRGFPRVSAIMMTHTVDFMERIADDLIPGSAHLAEFHLQFSKYFPPKPIHKFSGYHIINGVSSMLYGQLYKSPCFIYYIVALI